MPETFRLVVMDGVLHFPHGGFGPDVAMDRLEGVPSMLMAQRPQGDQASISFPLRTADDAENLMHALRAERECNTFFPDDANIELPDGTAFDLEGQRVLGTAGPSDSEDAGAEKRLLDHLANHPPDPGLRLDPNSTDPVIAEMFRLSALIDADKTLTRRRRQYLNMRLLVELNAYEAWQRQHASYFRDLTRWTPPAAPMPSGRLPLSEAFMSLPPELRPSIHIFADFGGFTHRTKFPPVDVLPMQRRPSLVPEEICDCMTEWTNEFNSFGWEESYGKFGSMLWVAFDMRGLSIARAVKRYVGDAARVFYSKPSEDPFFLYESYREIQSTLEISVREDCPV